MLRAAFAQLTRGLLGRPGAERLSCAQTSGRGVREVVDVSGAICVGFETAQELWRLVGRRVALANPASASVPPLLVRLLFDSAPRVDLGAAPSRTRVTKVPERIFPEALEELVASEPGLAARDVVACVSTRAGRRFVAGAECRLVTGSYPAGSFFRLRGAELVTSPELTFLQMARTLDDDLLILYGYELCGYFARSREEPGFVNCPALTSRARLEAYLDRVEALRRERGEGMPWGLGPARRALRHVRDLAASPEEAVVSMVLTLPSRRGGYAIPEARLNERVTLGARVARLFGIDSFVCDLSWDGGARVLEYQGSQHKLRSRKAYDMRKGNVLVADERSVIKMDRSMLSSRDRMDEVAKAVSRTLGIPWREPSASVATRRIRLRNKLIASIDER